LKIDQKKLRIPACEEIEVEIDIAVVRGGGCGVSSASRSDGNQSK